MLELPGVHQVKLDAVHGRDDLAADDVVSWPAAIGGAAGPVRVSGGGGWAVKLFGDLGPDGRMALTDPRGASGSRSWVDPVEVPQVGVWINLRRMGAGGPDAGYNAGSGAVHRRAGPAGGRGARSGDWPRCWRRGRSGGGRWRCGCRVGAPPAQGGSDGSAVAGVSARSRRHFREGDGILDRLEVGVHDAVGHRVPRLPPRSAPAGRALAGPSISPAPGRETR